MPGQEPQITELDLLQAIVTSQTSLQEQNNLIIEMLSTLLPSPQSEESQEPSLKDLMMLMLEQQQQMIDLMSLQSKNCERTTESPQSVLDKDNYNRSTKDE